MLFRSYSDKTLRLSDDNRSRETIAGPYLAMYLYRYRNFRWINWVDERKPSLQSVRELTKELDWEEYIFSIIVKEGTTDKEVDAIIKKAGYVPDYILEINNGLVNLLHQTNHIDSLIKNGYILTDTKDGEENYSFGRGVYCLDKDNFANIESEWASSDNVYTGVYEGEYLRCIEDIDSDCKSGKNKKFQQEILIPFSEGNIKWEIK